MAVVMPIPDTGVGLPRQRLNRAAHTALDIPDQALALFLVENLPGYDGIEFASARQRYGFFKSRRCGARGLNRRLA